MTWVVDGFAMVTRGRQTTGAYVLTRCSECGRVRKWAVFEYLEPCQHKGPKTPDVET